MASEQHRSKNQNDFIGCSCCCAGRDPGKGSAAKENCNRYVVSVDMGIGRDPDTVLEER